MYYTKEHKRLYNALRWSIEDKAYWTDTAVLDVLQAEIAAEAEKEAEYWDIMTGYCDSDYDTMDYKGAKADWELSYTLLSLLEDLLIDMTA